MGRREGAVIGGIAGAAKGFLVFAVGLGIFSVAVALFFGRISLVQPRILGSEAGAEAADYASLDILDATDSEREEIAGALSRLNYTVDPSMVTVRVVADDGEAFPGAYIHPSGVILVRRDIVNDGGDVLRGVLAHEIGHLVDDKLLTMEERQAFGELRGHPEGVHWYAEDLSWESRPVEDFAVVFGALAKPGIPWQIPTTYGRIDDVDAIASLLEEALPEGVIQTEGFSLAGATRILHEQVVDLAEGGGSQFIMILAGLHCVVVGMRSGIRNGREHAGFVTRPSLAGGSR